MVGASAPTDPKNRRTDPASPPFLSYSLDMLADNAGTPSSITLGQPRSASASRTPITPDVRLYHRAVVVAQETHGERIASVGCATHAMKCVLWRGRAARCKAGTETSSPHIPSPTPQARSVAWSANCPSTSSRMKAGA